MNSLSALQEVWAAIAASPGCCRLLAVSVEVAVLAVAVWCLIRVLRIRSARVCSLLWILVLAKGLFGLAFGAPLEVGALRLTEPARLSQSATAAMSAEDLARQDAEMQRALREAESSAGATAASAPNGTDGTHPSSQAVGAQMPYPSTPSVLSGVFASIGRFSFAAHAAGVLTAVWLAGVLWALLATALDLRRIRDLARASGAPSEDLLAVFRAEAARLGIARVPALSVCAEVESPALAGFLRPTVLAPAWLAETADPGQLRWMLAHELMHYKQKDTVGLLVRRAAQVALWFHPAVWWAGRQWEEAMERACDRALIAGEADARHYAEQLHGVLKSLLARRSRTRVVTGLFATRTQIGKRIAALLTDSLAMPARLSPSSATLVAFFAAAALSFGVGIHRPAAAQGPGGVAAPQPKPDPAVQERVTRVQADLRSLTVAMESYRVDYDNYPVTLPSLTTPIAYLGAKIPTDPFSQANPPDPYRLEVEPASGHHLVLYSVGPDGTGLKALPPYDPNAVAGFRRGDTWADFGPYLGGVDPALKAKIQQQQSEVDGAKQFVELWYAKTRQGLPDSLETVVKDRDASQTVPDDLFVPGRKLSYRLAEDKQTAWIYSLGPDGKDDGGNKRLAGIVKKGEAPSGDIFVAVTLASLQDRFPVISDPLDRRLLDHIPMGYHQYQKPLVEALLDFQEKENRPNALLYYVAATFVMPANPGDIQKDLIASVTASGWSAEAESLRPYLELSQPAFALIRKGAALDYARGIGLLEGAPTPVPNFLGIQLAAKSLCVEAHYFESQGRLHDALENHLTGLTMGRDLMSPNNPLISSLIGIAVANIMMDRMPSLLTNERLAAADLERCRARLEALDKSWPGLGDAFRLEGQGVQRVVSRMRKDGNAEALIAEWTRQGVSLEWLEPGRAERYRKAAKNLDRVEAEQKKGWDLLQRYAETPWWKQDRNIYQAEIMPFETDSLFPIPSVLEASVRWNVAKAGLGLVRMATGLEAYKKANGKYAASLDALTPAQIGAEPPIDPFSGEPLLYRLDGDRYTLWSVGPDGKDDGGTVIYDPKNGTVSPGDIVMLAAPAGPATAPANPAVSLAAAAPSVNGAAGSLPTKSSLYVAVRRDGSRVGLERILLRMGKDGEERQVPLDSLSREVAKAKVSFPDLRVVIESGADSASATVVGVLEEVRKGGVEDMVIQVVPEKPGGPTVPATNPAVPAK